MPLTGMHALSLYQPLASLVVRGVKTIETRKYGTRVRGRIAIAATVETPMKFWNEYITKAQVLDAMEREWGRIFAKPDQMPRGVILGAVTIASVEDAPTCRDAIVACHESPLDPALALGDFSAGRFAWHLCDPIELAEPIKARGGQRLWRWNPPECNAPLGGKPGYLPTAARCNRPLFHDEPCEWSSGREINLAVRDVFKADAEARTL